MSLARQIIVSLSSFGASNVRLHGQRRYVELCAEAGADGVEIRGELLNDPARELPGLASCLDGVGLRAVFSSPAMLWDRTGALDRDALELGLAAAATLRAPVLKMSIGGYGQASRTSLVELQGALSDGKVELLIENDQTPRAGSVSSLRRFFEAADETGIHLGMTFDMGNWHWVGESSLQAAGIFAPRVRYVHCKGVQRQPGRWVAVALQESSAPWRAVLRAMPDLAPRAIEYPLVGEDVEAVTRGAIQDLRTLGDD
ncbi:MAG TPA: TIM barrel protein [Burkholderiaceae bacterium]|nr:TIM barrel protein [Burkholderiaceae bacterium]